MTRVLALRFDSLGDRSHEMTKRRAQTSCAEASNQCHHEMRIVSLINDAQIIERILRHVGMWVSEVCNQGVRILLFVLLHPIFTLIAWNRRFTVDLSRVRS